MNFKLYSILVAILTINLLNAQKDSSNVFLNWFKGNQVSIRQTFDGSKNENSPASIKFAENHRSNNDFFNIDLAIKISEYRIIKDADILNFYPKIEYHKSTDSIEQKDKLSGGINFEFFPVKLKAQNLASELPNKGWSIAPWFLATSSFKRNFIDNVNETNLAFQLSFASNFKFLPGSSIRDKNQNFRARYYPYFGLEYNYIPDLVQEGTVEEFNTYFIRLFAEIWIVPEIVQTNIIGIYRRNLQSSSLIRQDLPQFNFQLNFYPGKQNNISIGYEYNNGYAPNSRFNLIKTSSLKLNLTI